MRANKAVVSGDIIHNINRNLRRYKINRPITLMGKFERQLLKVR